MAKVNTRTQVSKTGKKLLVRNAQTSDAETILSNSKAVMDEGLYTLTQSDELTLTEEEEKKWIETVLEHPNRIAIVGEVDGKLVGLLDFREGHRRRISHTGEFGMSILAGYREEGLGRLMLQVLIDWAREHPRIEKINLRVHESNTRARNLYRSTGFQEEGLLSRDMKIAPGRYENTVLMGLWVGSKG